MHRVCANILSSTACRLGGDGASRNDAGQCEWDDVTAGEARIPALGCGTWQLRGELCANIVAEALRVGFRHIDTAQGYDNEAAVGEGIRASGVRRDDVFVTTKVQPQLVSRRRRCRRSVEESLKRLGLD